MTVFFEGQYLCGLAASLLAGDKNQMRRTKFGESAVQLQWSALPSRQAAVSVLAGLLCLPLASLGAPADPLASPGAPADKGAGPATGLEEIVVTAEKRESTVQKTPISLTAITGADIQDRGLTDLSSLLQSVPGVSIRTSGPGLTEFELRGIASTGGNSPTVGFYLGDTSLTAPAASNEGKVVISPDLYDLNRIEVLRGPQGTLYGSGSMGGTIKVVPNAPNPSGFDASAEATLGDTADSITPRMPWSISLSEEASQQCASSAPIPTTAVLSTAW
jgi:outer membrane receptor protein involved in Fe transport